MKNKKINWWKWSFLLLCLTLFSFTIFIVVSIYASSHEPFMLETNDHHVEGASFKIVTNKKDINYWLQKELLKEQVDSPIEYHLFLDDYVYLQARVDVFGMVVPFQLVLDPIIQESGNLLLEGHSFHVGNFTVDSSFVFQLIASRFNLPDWMVVYPEEGRIYLNLRDGLFENLQIGVNHLDLEADKIEFSLTYYK